MSQSPFAQPSQAAYPYSAYRPSSGVFGSYPATAAYPGAAAYQTGVTGYGSWPYQYGYVSQHAQSRPTIPTATAPTPTFSPTVPQRSTFTPYTPTYPRDTVAVATTTSVGGGVAAGVGRPPRKQTTSFKGSFTKELKNLMYGFGDDRNPVNDTVEVMEEILLEFISDLCSSAGAPTRKSRLAVEDLRRALSRPADAKKLARMEELLFMQEDIKRARAQFEDADINHTFA